MHTRTFGKKAWAAEEQRIQKLPPGMASVGIGDDLVRRSGIPAEQIVGLLYQVFAQIIDGGACVGMLNNTRCYFRRRGKAVDIGTRHDFEDLGWAKICDLCDAHAEAAN